jgi:hypothetical protein
MRVKMTGELSRRHGVSTDATDHDIVRGDGDQQVHGGQRSGVGQVVTDRVLERGARRTSTWDGDVDGRGRGRPGHRVL